MERQVAEASVVDGHRERFRRVLRRDGGRRGWEMEGRGEDDDDEEADEEHEKSQDPTSRSHACAPEAGGGVWRMYSTVLMQSKAGRGVLDHRRHICCWAGVGGR